MDSGDHSKMDRGSFLKFSLKQMMLAYPIGFLLGKQYAHFPITEALLLTLAFVAHYLMAEFKPTLYRRLGLSIMTINARVANWIYLQLKVSRPSKRVSKGEDWIRSLGWFIPRKYRSDIVGDIVEDCGEMRGAGCKEWRVKIHVVYQWLIAVITLVPAAVKASIVDAVKQVISPSK